MTRTSKKWWQDMKCTCDTNKPKNCILHSCPCGCDMSIDDENYQDTHMTNIFYETKN